MTPRATYRVQLRKSFDFAAAAEIAPYLAQLGVSHVYASPIMAARSGSAHGYDVIDPTRINPELGGEDGLRAFVATLRAHGLGLIVDIVPNHMAVGADNPWWLDVMEHGPASRHADVFDIDWSSSDPTLNRRLALPFLDTPYGQALESGGLQLAYDDALQRIVVAYQEHRFPLRPESAAALLREARLETLEQTDAQDRLRPVFAARETPTALHGLLEEQHWRLSWWRTAGDELNWRRFFDITGLAGVRVEDAGVFEAVHATLFRLYAEGLLDGVRIDHIDGLADPAVYLQRLRARLTALEAQRPAEAPVGPAYIVVEKILAVGERLPADWPVDGATGYEFMDDVSALLHDAAGEPLLSETWRDISGRALDFVAEEALARAEMLRTAFAGQHAAAARAFHRLASAAIPTRDITCAALHRALAALLEGFPVYRSYAAAEYCPPLSAPVARAFDRARARAGADAHALDFIRSVVAGPDNHDPTCWREAVRRLQQLSAPIAAKAVEDTALYRYARLLSRNDVGFDAARLAMPIEDFHARCAERWRRTPHTLLATATHDHKRGEDVRARLAVLSEIPERWAAFARGWLERSGARDAGVDPGDAYILLQTLVGAWQFDLDARDAGGLSRFAKRVIAWQTKALREQKLRSSWIAPDEAYEAACATFISRCLDPAHAREIATFVDEIAPAGAANALAQLFLRCVTPGAPDCYQGCERWDFSLVDPDNRSSVDFGPRRAAADGPRPLAELARVWRDGRIKQALLAALLGVRTHHTRVFLDGGYEPLKVSGLRREHVIAFARTHGEGVLIAAACRCIAQAPGEGLVPDRAWWGDTRIALPGARPARPLIGGEAASATAGALPADELFATLPVVLLISSQRASTN